MNNTQPIHTRAGRLNCIIFAKLFEILWCAVVGTCTDGVSGGTGCWLSKELMLCCVGRRRRVGIKGQGLCSAAKLRFEGLFWWTCAQLGLEGFPLMLVGLVLGLLFFKGEVTLANPASCPAALCPLLCWARVHSLTFTAMPRPCERCWECNNSQTCSFNLLGTSV